MSTFIALALLVALVTTLATVHPSSDPAAAAVGTLGERNSVTPPTPPSQFNCVGFGSALAVLHPDPADGIAGTVVELEGSGYYNRTSGPLGSFTLWMANYSGGSVLYLTTVPAGSPEDFYVNVTVPARNATSTFVPGAYEFWSLENYTPNATCANAPFTLTGVPPSSIGCLSWTASLNVTSPEPATGTAGSSVTLQGRGFSTGGSTSIYWADPSGSPSVLVGTQDASPLLGEFNATVSVPTGYSPGNYEFWGVDGDSDCSGAGFVLTASPSPPVLKLDLPAGDPGSVVSATGSNFGMDVAVSFTFDGKPVASTCSTNGTGSFPASSSTPCKFTVPIAPNGDDGGQNVVATDTSLNQASTSFSVTPEISLSPDQGPIGTSFTVTGSGFSPYPSAAVVYFDGPLITPTGGSDCDYNANPLITLDSMGGFVCTYTVPTWATPGVNLVQGDDTNTSQLTVDQQWTVPGQGGSGSGSCPASSGVWGAIMSYFSGLPTAEQVAIVALILSLLVGLGYAIGAGGGSAAGAGSSAGTGGGSGGSGNTGLETGALDGAHGAISGAVQGAVSGAGSANSTANSAISAANNATASANAATSAAGSGGSGSGGSGGSGR